MRGHSRGRGARAARRRMVEETRSTQRTRSIRQATDVGEPTRPRTAADRRVRRVDAAIPDAPTNHGESCRMRRRHANGGSRPWPRSPTVIPSPPSKPEGDVDAARKGQSNSQAVVSMSRLTPCPQIRHFGRPPPFTPHRSTTPERRDYARTSQWSFLTLISSLCS